MESSRILPKERRFDPFRSPADSKKFSPVAKIKNISRRSLEFLSRPFASSTPSDVSVFSTDSVRIVLL